MANVKPLVKELLTMDDIKQMIKISDVHYKEFDIHNYLCIVKGWLKTWDDECHNGYIIHHLHKEKCDTYFMEVEVYNPRLNINRGVCEYNSVIYHKLLPLSKVPTDDKSYYNLIPVRNIGELANRIIAINGKDNYGYYPANRDKPVDLVNNSENLTINNIDYWEDIIPDDTLERLRKEENQKRRDIEKEIIDRFSKGELPPPEDDLWYSVLADVDSAGFGDKTLETKVLKILNDRGINAYIDGERDSFGWVTRGIFIDGKIMCIY